MLVHLVCSVYLVCLFERTNQMNQINQINNTNQINQIARPAYLARQRIIGQALGISVILQQHLPSHLFRMNPSREHS